MKVKLKIGTVCSKCGIVYKGGQKFAQAWGLSSWEREGYVREICPECKQKGDTNDLSIFSTIAS